MFARHAADELFSEIDEIGIRDGANLVVEGYDFAPTFSIWTTIEECLNPPVIWEKGRGWYTTEPFSEPEVFDFPEGIGPVECVNVEHEEVLLVPRVDRLQARHVQVRARRRVHRRAQDAAGSSGSTRRRRCSVRDVEVAPRDVVAATLPDPMTLGDRMIGKTCAGTLVTGPGKDGRPRKTYLYHVVDNEWSMREYGSQAVVWQTALNPVVALELIAEGAWSGTGVLGPESFPAQPFLDKLAEFGSPHGVLELSDAGGVPPLAVALSSVEDDERRMATWRSSSCAHRSRSSPADASTRSRVRPCWRRSWRWRAACPAIAGWVLDERRAIRAHVNVYVNGQLAREDTASR